MPQTGPENVDVFLLPTRAWASWRDGAGALLTDEQITVDKWNVVPSEFCTFRTRYGKRAFAFCIEAKRLDYTAVVTKAILDHFATPGGNPWRCRVGRLIMLGFCG